LNHTVVGVVQLRFAWARILPPAATRERNARAWLGSIRAIAREVLPVAAPISNRKIDKRAKLHAADTDGGRILKFSVPS